LTHGLLVAIVMNKCVVLQACIKINVVACSFIPGSEIYHYTWKINQLFSYPIIRLTISPDSYSVKLQYASYCVLAHSVEVESFERYSPF
jgi:hypothetical protein